MSSIVVATPDVVGSLMAGPGIRAWHFAEQLSSIGDVALVGRWNGDLVPAGVRPLEWGSGGATRAIRSADVVVGQPHPVLLRRHRARRVLDLFDPVVLELDELYGPRMRLRQRVHQRLEWARLERALDEGDLLLAATPRQRDFYWGIQRSRSPVTPEWMERWETIPFGVGSGASIETPQTPPRIVWSGGLWGWLDPELAFTALQRLDPALDVRLVVTGGARPGGAGASPRAAALRAAAAALGERVEWIEDWIPYESRWSALAGARLALALHKRTVEAEFSIRIRLFDAIAAAVPMVVTRGGFVADLVERHGLGIVVEPGDAGGVVGAVRKLVTDDEFHGSCRAACLRIAPTMPWESVVAPLRRRIERWLG